MRFWTEHTITNSDEEGTLAAAVDKSSRGEGMSAEIDEKKDSMLLLGCE